MLNPNRLQLLVQLAALGTMRRVADATNQTVSSVSHQLGELERQAGVPLLSRHGRRVRLTSTAEELVRLSRPILEDLAAVHDFLVAGSKDVTGEVRVAAFTSAFEVLLLPVIGDLRQRFPDLVVQVHELEPDASLPLVAAGVLDLAVTASFSPPQPDPGQESPILVPLVRDELRVLLPASHPLARRTAIAVGDLAEERWLLEPKGGHLADFMARAAASPFRDAGRIASYPLVLEAVRAGLGIAVLPAMAARAAPSGLVAIPLAPRSDRHVSAAVLPSRLQRRSVRAVLDVLQDWARSAAASLHTADAEDP